MSFLGLALNIARISEEVRKFVPNFEEQGELKTTEIWNWAKRVESELKLKN